MTGKKAYTLISQLKLVYDTVRLVDMARTRIFELDADGNIKAEPYRRLTGAKGEDGCGNCEYAAECIRTGLCECANRDAYQVTGKYINIDNVPYILELISEPAEDEEESLEKYGGDRFLTAIRDMKNRAYMDSLTEVYNRRYYDERLANLSLTSALAVIDVDNFKDVNDNFGHLAGDEALREIARTIRTSIRSTDTLVRYGGDEFLLVIMDIPREHFLKRLELVRTAVERIRLAAYPQIRLTVSIGGHYRSSGLDQMFEEADKELYLAKRTKNTVLVS